MYQINKGNKKNICTCRQASWQLTLCQTVRSISTGIVSKKKKRKKVIYIVANINPGLSLSPDPCNRQLRRA